MIPALNIDNLQRIHKQILKQSKNSVNTERQQEEYNKSRKFMNKLNRVQSLYKCNSRQYLPVDAMAYAIIDKTSGKTSFADDLAMRVARNKKLKTLENMMVNLTGTTNTIATQKAKSRSKVTIEIGDSL